MFECFSYHLDIMRCCCLPRIRNSIDDKPHGHIVIKYSLLIIYAPISTGIQCVCAREESVEGNRTIQRNETNRVADIFTGIIINFADLML